MTRRIGVGLGLLALSAALAVAGHGVLFTTFMVYDDEGYVLMSLRSFAAQGSLYEVVYSQYGPAFFLVYDALHQALGFAWNHTNSRWLTLVHWLGIAGFSAALVHHIGRQAAATALTLAGVFVTLWVMSREPMHPGGPVALLAAVAAWWGVRRDPASSWVSALVIGAIGTAMVFIKINTGIFMLTAAGAWLLLNSAPPARARRVLTGVTLGALIILPWALMRGLLAQGWVQVFAGVAAVAVAGITLVAHRLAQPAADRKVWGGFVAGGLLVAGFTVVGIHIAGTSWTGILRGVLLAPLQHPGVYFFPFNWRPGTLVVAFVAAVAVGWWYLRPADPRARRLLVGLRLAAAGGFVAGAFGWFGLSLVAFCLSYGLPLAAVCAVPLTDSGAARTAARARAWLALLFALQCLHAYPVAGSQLNWGAFLGVPLVVLAVLELVPLYLAERTRRWAATGAVALAVAVTALLGRSAWENQRAGEPLALPGAAAIVLPDDTVFGLRIIAENAARTTDTLFSLPGAFSFNLWTGRPTPTFANVTHWFSLLNEDQQREIIAVLDADPRAGVVIPSSTLSYVIEHGFVPTGPLVDYIAAHFQRALSVDGFNLWLKPGRSIAAVNTGSWLPSDPDPALGRFRVVIESTAQTLDHIKVSIIDGPRRHPLHTLPVAGTPLSIVPLDDAGHALGAPQPWSGAAALPAGLIELNVPSSAPGSVAPSRLLLELFNPAGERFAAVRILE